MERPTVTYFNTNWRRLRFLLHPAQLNQPWHYALALFCAFTLAFSQQALEHGWSLYEEHLRQRLLRHNQPDGSLRDTTTTRRCEVGWDEQAARTAIMVPRVALGYVLMFMGMTLDVGVVVSVLAGMAVGFFVWRRRIIFGSARSVKIP